MSWPLLREELALLPGPRLADGQPSWTLHDPTRNRFFSLDWATFEVLRRWSYADAESIEARRLSTHALGDLAIGERAPRRSGLVGLCSKGAPGTSSAITQRRSVGSCTSS